MNKLTSNALTAPLYGLLAVNDIPANTFTRWTDEFAGSALTTAWVPMYDPTGGGGSGALIPYPNITGGTWRADVAGVFQGAALQVFPRLDGAKAHSLDCLIDIREGFAGQQFGLSARLANTGRVTWTITNTVYATVTLSNSSGDLAVAYTLRVNGTSTGSSGTLTIPASQVKDEYLLSLELCSQSLNTYVAMRWDDKELTSRTDLTSATAGTRFGVQALMGASGSPAVITRVRVNHYETTSGLGTDPQVVAVDAGGLPKLLSNADPMALSATATASPSAMRLNTSGFARIRGVQKDGKVFFCENDAVVHEGDDGRVIQLGGGVNTAGLHANSAFSSASVDQHVAEVYNVQGWPLAGAWPITAINASPIYVKLDEAYATIEFPATTSCSYRIRRPNKYLDLRNNTMYRWLGAPGKGVVPMGCYGIGLFADRLVMFDDVAFYMSRTGDPFDWDYFANITASDTARAQIVSLDVTGSTIDRPAAFWSWADRKAILAGRRSLYILSGDPGAGGYVYELEDSGGVAGPDAWCKSPDGTTFYLGREGLMRLSPDARAFPERVSRDKIPREFLDETYFAWSPVGPMLAYDVEMGGILIIPDLTDSGQPGDEIACWWVDADNFGFWPHTIRRSLYPRAITVAPTFAVGVTQAWEYSLALMGCDDGHVRNFYTETANDERNSGTYAITNHVTLGPIALGDGGTLQGTLEWMQAESRVSGGTLTYEVRIGETPQQAAAASIAATGTLTDYLSTVKPIERSSKWAFVTLRGGTDCRWALERIDARIREQGYTSTK